MKSDFLLAITQLSAEKNLPKEIVISAVEAALVSAYRKDNFAPNQNISVKINPTSGKVEVRAEKEIVEKVSDSRREIALAEARRLKKDVQLGETIEVEATPQNAGRIAAQTAKQVILQRLHEAEHSVIFEEYAGKEGTIVTGLVQRIEPKQILLDLGRTEAVLPQAEQVRSERYRIGQRIKVIILEVARAAKGPMLVVSRSHPELLRRLFELEVPEIYNGIVEIKSIAREAGYRSKVAVAARQEGIDPVGCCVGLRGIRIQNIVNELNGERIDVVMWSPEISTFIANALSPAQILSVEIKGEGGATVVVPDRQLSLAIGKEGQNVRLAAKITGMRIDIKSASAAELEKAAAQPPVTEEKEEVAVGEEQVAAVAAAAEPIPVVEESTPAEKIAEPVTVTVPGEPEEPGVPPPAVVKPQIRFAEELITPAPARKSEVKPGKKKKKTGRERDEDGVRLRKGRRLQDISMGDEEEEY